jgi:hypothetical protein
MAHTCTLPFLFWEYHCALANCSFAAVFAASKLARLQHLRHIAGKGQCYGSSKIQLSEANHLAVVVHQVARYCSENAVHAGRAWRKLSLLAAIVFSSQATVLMHHLKPLSGL